MKRKELEQRLEGLHSDSFAWALRCCSNDKMMAEDILQKTYLKLLEGKAKYKGQSSFKTWLFSIIRFTAIDSFRKQKKTELIIDYQPVTDDNATLAFSPNSINNTLQQLSPQQQKILHLVFYQNCTIEEAAKIMNLQIGTARTHYARAKRQMKKHLLELKSSTI